MVTFQNVYSLICFVLISNLILKRMIALNSVNWLPLLADVLTLFTQKLTHKFKHLSNIVIRASEVSVVLNRLLQVANLLSKILDELADLRAFLFVFHEESVHVKGFFNRNLVLFLLLFVVSVNNSI